MSWNKHTAGVMRSLIFLLAFCIAGCTPRGPTPEKVAADFYHYYLSAFDQPDAIALTSAEMRRYVAADTLNRLSAIENIEEQDINESDYLSYSQDYDPSWVSALKVDQPSPLIGGAVVPVSIGIENGGHILLSVFMRHEDGAWKIYRVRDETDDYEQPIFDAGRLAAALKHAKELQPIE